MKEILLQLLTIAYASVGIIAFIGYWPTIKDLYKYKKARIKWDEIQARPQDVVILAKDNFYFRRVTLRKLNV